MAEPGEQQPINPTSTTATPAGLTPEQLYQLALETAGISAEGMTEAANIGGQYTLEGVKQQQKFISEGAERAAALYQPYIDAGGKWGKNYTDRRAAGPPQYNWDKEFSYSPYSWDKKFTPEAYNWDKKFEYDPFKFDKKFDYQSFGDFSKERFTPEGAKNSPYYGLYQFQKQQQEQDTNASLRARGLYGSGAGMKQALNAQSGLDEKFAAGEYTRGVGEYGMGLDQANKDYERQYNIAVQGHQIGFEEAAKKYGMSKDEYDKAYGINYNTDLTQYNQEYEANLQQHNIGYEEAKQKYGMTLDQYNREFGVKTGQYESENQQDLGLVNYGWLGTQGIANARFGAGSQMGQGALQGGQTMAGLQSSLASGIGSTYNAAMNSGAGMYNAAANRNLTQDIQGQNQANYNAANAANQNLGYATLGSGFARSGVDAYRYYNQSTASPTTPTYTNPGYGTGYGNIYGNAPYTGNFAFGD